MAEVWSKELIADMIRRNPRARVAYISNSIALTERSASDPASAQSASEPSASEPSASEPSASEPATAEPTSELSASEP
jgi:hypothetical protein